MVVALICIGCKGEETKEQALKTSTASSIVSQDKEDISKDDGNLEIAKDNSKSEEKNNASTEIKKVSTNSNSAASKAAPKEPSQASTSKSSSSSLGSSSSNTTKPVTAPTTSTSTTPSTPVHTHVWEPIYATRTVPVYESKRVVICDDCGAILSGAGGMSIEERSAHMEMHIDNGDKYGGGSHTENRKIQTGTTTEKYISGYKCSCGASK